MATKPLHSHIHKLTILSTLVESGNFRDAGTRCRVTQSAISQTVAQLEALFEQTLLVRERGSVRPTASCSRLLAEVRPILDAIDALSAKGFGGALDPEAPALKSLDFGTYESIALDVIAPLIQRLMTRLPGLKLTVRTARSPDLTTLVRKGELCMALVVENDRMHGLEVIPLVEDRLGLFRAKARAPLLKSGYATISFGADGPPRYYQRFIRAAGDLGKPALLCDSFETVRAAVADGCMVGVLPHRVAFRRAEDLVPIGTPTGKGEIGTHGLCLVSRKSCDPRENAFLADELRAVLRAPRPPH